MLQAVLFDLDNTLANTKEIEEIRERGNYDLLNEETLRNVHAYPKCHDLIVALKEKGVKVGIVTNSARAYAQKVLAHIGLPGFDVIVTYNDVGMKGAKPNPDGILKAVDELELEANENIIYIGDNYKDIVAAYRAKVKPAICSWAHRYPVSQSPSIELSTEYLLDEIDSPENLKLIAELTEEHESFDFSKKRLYFLPVDLSANVVTLKDDMKIFVLGRYFSQKSIDTIEYHHNHKLSKKIAEKNSNKNFKAPDYWVDLISHCVEKIPDYHHECDKYDIVTVIPAKSGRPQRLEDLLSRVQAKLNDSKILFIPDIFEFSKDAGTQKTLAGDERYDSAKSSISVNKSHIDTINGSNILIIDDVITTGATLRVAIELLEALEPSSVKALAIAKTVTIKSLEEKECPECSRMMQIIKRKDSDIYFWGCTGYHEDPQCKNTENYIEKDCPICGRGMVKKRRRKDGVYFLSCSGYNLEPSCNYSESLD